MESTLIACGLFYAVSVYVCMWQAVTTAAIDGKIDSTEVLCGILPVINLVTYYRYHKGDDYFVFGGLINENLRYRRRIVQEVIELTKRRGLADPTKQELAQALDAVKEPEGFFHSVAGALLDSAFGKLTVPKV